MLLLFLVTNLNRKKIYFEFLVFFTKIMELIKEDTLGTITNLHPHYFEMDREIYLN